MSATADDDAENGELPGGWQPLDDNLVAPETSGGNGPATRAPMTAGNRFSPEVTRAIEGVKFIAEHLKKEDEARYVSHVFGVIFFIFFLYFTVE